MLKTSLNCTILFMLLQFVACSIFTPNSSPDHVPQVVQIFFHFNKYDELNTFDGTYQKDLIPGLAKTKMWLTKNEQEIILTKLEETRFFSFPDTMIIYPPQGVAVAPDLGEQQISIKYGSYHKTVLWYAAEPANNKSMTLINDLKRLLIDIIFAKREYKALPPAKGGYM